MDVLKRAEKESVNTLISKLYSQHQKLSNLSLQLTIQNSEDTRTHSTLTHYTPQTVNYTLRSTVYTVITTPLSILGIEIFQT